MLSRPSSILAPGLGLEGPRKHADYAEGAYVKDVSPVAFPPAVRYGGGSGPSPDPRRFGMRVLTLAALALIFALPARGGDPKPKQDAKAEAVAKEWKRLEGTWEIVSLRVDGKAKETPEDERPKLWLPAGAPGLTY